jgi:hypothetical protein
MLFEVIFAVIFSLWIAYGIKKVKEGDLMFGWFYIIFNSFALLMPIIQIIRLL